MSTSRSKRTTSRRAPAPARSGRPDAWQRERLFAAMLDEVAANGYERTRIGAVAARAGLDEDAFHRNFPDKEACLLAAFDSLTAQIHAHMVSAYQAPSAGWHASVRAAVANTIRSVYARPGVARVYLSDMAMLGPRAQAHQSWALMLFGQTLAEMLRDSPDDHATTPDELSSTVQSVWQKLADGVSAVSPGSATASFPDSRREQLLNAILQLLPGAAP